MRVATATIEALKGRSDGPLAKRRDAHCIELAYGDFGLRPCGICFPQSGLVLKSRKNEISVHRRFRGELSNEHSGGREARGGCVA